MATTGQGVLRRLLVVFEFGVDLSKVDAGKKKLDTLFKDMQKVAAAFAGGAIAKGIGNFVKDTVDEMMLIRKGAQELRITTDEMQMLRSAGRALGMDVKWLHFSLERLQVSTELAARGSARQAASMRLLGLETKKANGEHKSAMELFLDMADGIQKLKDPSKQAIAVWDMFGRGGHRLLPMLRLGRERIQELMNATKEYGRYEQQTIDRAAEYTITLEHLRLVWTGIRDYIMSEWLPLLDKQTGGLIKTGKWMHQMMKNSHLAKSALLVLQAAMVGLTLKMMAAYPYATMLIGALGVLVLTLDALQVWWEHGESIITSILDGVFGKGTSTAVLERAHALWKGIRESIEAIQRAMGIDKPNRSDDGPRGGGAAAPELGDNGQVTASYSPWAMALGAITPGAQVAHRYANVPGGVEVRRGFWERLFDLEGKRLNFTAPTINDTQTRPDNSPNMSIGDVHITFPQMSVPEGQNAMSLGEQAARGFTEQMDAWWSSKFNERTQGAHANLRREKQSSGE